MLRFAWSVEFSIYPHSAYKLLTVRSATPFPDDVLATKASIRSGQHAALYLKAVSLPLTEPISR